MSTRILRGLQIVFVLAAAAAIIVPRVVGTSGTRFNPYLAKLPSIQGALDHFHLDVGRFPTNIEGLDALLSAPSGLGQKWQGPYISRPLEKGLYLYIASKKGYTLTSYAADGKPSGEGWDKDITVTN